VIDLSLSLSSISTSFSCLMGWLIKSHPTGSSLAPLVLSLFWVAQDWCRIPIKAVERLGKGSLVLRAKVDA
jgi:hypothetical protein